MWEHICARSLLPGGHCKVHVSSEEAARAGQPTGHATQVREGALRRLTGLSLCLQSHSWSE